MHYAQATLDTSSSALCATWCGERWIGHVQGHLGPLKEANAAVILTEHGFKTQEQVALEMGGGDWESNIEQLAIENQRLAEAGGGRIVVPIDPKAAKEKEETNEGSEKSAARGGGHPPGGLRHGDY